MGDVRGVILDVILDVIWIYFGRHFGDPGGDPVGATRGNSGRVVEITSSETWSFAQAGWPVGGCPSQMQKIGVRKTQKNKVLLAIGLDLGVRSGSVPLKRWCSDAGCPVPRSSDTGGSETGGYQACGPRLGGLALIG